MSGAKRSKISDVAGLAGVSKSTISNFLNGRYSNMSMETRERIAAAIKQLNYVPSISARRLSSKIKCDAICLVIPINLSRTFDTLYYPTVLSAVGDISGKTGYDTLIYARGKSERKLEYLKGMAGTMVDGFILFDLRSDNYYFREFQKASIPYVCVGKYRDINDYNYVASDHGTAIEDAVQHLIELGHTDIGLLLEKNKSVVADVREQSFYEALSQYGIQPNPAHITYVETQVPVRSEQNRIVCQALLLRKDRPTAVISPTGTLHILEKIAEESSIAIPRDLSVIAMDYMDGYNLLHDNYTRFDSMADEVAKRAFLKLTHYIQHRKEGFSSEILPLHLIPGDTTAPPAR